MGGATMLKTRIESVLKAELDGKIKPPALNSLIERTYKYLEDCPVGYESNKVNQVIVFVAVKLINECNLEKPLPRGRIGDPRPRTNLQKAFSADNADALLEELRNILLVPSIHELNSLAEKEKELYTFIHNQVRASAYMPIRTLFYEGYIENFHCGVRPHEEEAFYDKCKKTHNRFLPFFQLYQKEQSSLSFNDDCEIPIEASALIRYLTTLYEDNAGDNALHWMMKPKAGTKTIEENRPDLLDAINFLADTRSIINKSMPDSPINGNSLYNSIRCRIFNIFLNQLSNAILKNRKIPKKVKEIPDCEKAKKRDEARKRIDEATSDYLDYTFRILLDPEYYDALNDRDYHPDWDYETNTWKLSEKERECLKEEDELWRDEETVWWNAMEAAQRKKEDNQ